MKRHFGLTGLRTLKVFSVHMLSCVGVGGSAGVLDNLRKLNHIILT